MSHDDSPAQLLREALVDGAIGTTPTDDGSWPIFVGHLPDSPDNALCVYDTAGRLDGRNQRSGLPTVHPGFQLRVRGTGHATAYSKIQAAVAFFATIKRMAVTVGGDDYRIEAVMQTSGILPLGPEPDGTRRISMTVNGTLTFAEVSA